MFKNIIKKIKLIFLFSITILQLFSMQQHDLSLEDVLRMHNIRLCERISNGTDKTVFEVERNGERYACSSFLPYKDYPGLNLKKLNKEHSFFNKYKHEGFIRVIESIGDFGCISDSGYCLLFTELAIKDLNEYIKEGYLSLFKDKIRILKNIIEPIAYLHANDVIHGDLKTKNIVICSNGSAKIIDPTASRTIGKEYYHPEGTFSFMPPEYLEDAIKYELRKTEKFSNITSEKFDIFAFGAIIHNVFYGNDIDVNVRKELGLASLENASLEDFLYSENHKKFLETYILRLKNDQIFIPDERIDYRINNLIQACLSSNIDKRPSAVEILKKLEEMTEKSEINALVESFDFSKIGEMSFYSVVEN